MNVKAVKKRLQGKLNVPSLPAVVTQVLALLEDADVGTREIGRVVGEDPPLTAKLLRVANSARYGLQAPVLSPEHAAAVLGLDAMRNLLMSVSVIDLFSHASRFPDFDVSHLWRHSQLCARVCEALPGEWSEHFSREDAYLCGLLHNIGVFVMLEQIGEDYVELLSGRKRERGPLSLRSLELETFQFSHDQIGYLVCRQWNLPPVLLNSIRNHLDRAGRVETDIEVAVVHCGNKIAKAVEAGKPRTAASDIRTPVLDLLGLDARTVNLFAEDAMDFLRDLEA